MAISPEIELKQRCKDSSMYFDDVTRNYDAVYYPGGYGPPNISGSDVTATSIEITTPGGLQYKKAQNYFPLSMYYMMWTPFQEAQYLKATDFIATDREPKPLILNAKDTGGTLTVYFRHNATGNVKIEITGGAALIAGEISSTTGSNVVAKIVDGVTNCNAIKALLETHNAIALVVTSTGGTNYKIGDSIIESTDGLTAIAKKLNSYESGCYQVQYQIYKNAIAPTTPLVLGKEYIVTEFGSGPGVAGYIIYDRGLGNELIYAGETFRATGSTFFVSLNCRVAEFEAETETTALYWCVVRENIKNLMLLSGDDKCDGCADFVQSLAELDTMLSSAMIAIEEDNSECGCETFKTLETLSADFIKRCCC